MGNRRSIAEELIAGFTDLGNALESNEDLGVRFNCYQMRLELEPQTYTPDLVRATRKQLGASQTVFARFLGVSPSTVRQWEQGQNTPNPMACRFMDEIQRNPKYYTKRLGESMVPKNRKKKRA
jgi:DNA-binding transcriptional regulator YiaG